MGNGASAKVNAKVPAPIGGDDQNVRSKDCAAERGQESGDRAGALSPTSAVSTTDEIDESGQPTDLLETPTSLGNSEESSPASFGNSEIDDAGYLGNLSPRSTDGQEESSPSSMAVKDDNDSPRSTNSHLFTWDQPAETLLLLDWDDTCFPTSAIGAASLQCDPDWWKESPEFQEYCDTICYFLRSAADACTVKIVTMATPDWIESCFARVRFIRTDFDSILSENRIELVFARKWLSGAALHSECRDTSHYLKTCAMKDAIREFYRSPRPGGGGRARSWKNILSIGDSQAERLALQDIAFQHQQRSRSGTWKDYRYKTLLTLWQPSLRTLIEELTIINKWLLVLLRADDDMDIELDVVTMDLIGDGVPIAEQFMLEQTVVTCG